MAGERGGGNYIGKATTRLRRLGPILGSHAEGEAYSQRQAKGHADKIRELGIFFVQLRQLFELDTWRDDWRTEQLLATLLAQRSLSEEFGHAKRLYMRTIR